MALDDKLLRASASAAFRLPEPLTRRLMGRQRRNQRGDLLDHHTQLLILAARMSGVGLDTGPVDEARTQFKKSANLATRRTTPPVPSEDSALAPGLPVRMYRGPGGACLLWLHGGGFCIGDLDTTDAFCQRACREAGLTVVSLDYRLAPEHPYPAAVEDAEAALRALVDRAAEFAIDPARIGIGGDSAGGNLSAVSCRRLRDAGGPMPAFQLLVYPSTDMRRDTDSYRELGRGYMLEHDKMDWFMDHYAAPELEADASPLLVEDLSGLPPAHVVTAGFDPLRDEGESYARRLEEAGVPTTHQGEPGLVHGFLQMDGASRAANHAVTTLLQALRDLAGS